MFGSLEWFLVEFCQELSFVMGIEFELFDAISVVVFFVAEFAFSRDFFLWGCLILLLWREIRI
jgi:hypothetical protein